MPSQILYDQPLTIILMQKLLIKLSGHQDITGVSFKAFKGNYEGERLQGFWALLFLINK